MPQLMYACNILCIVEMYGGMIADGDTFLQQSNDMSSRIRVAEHFYGVVEEDR